MPSSSSSSLKTCTSAECSQPISILAKEKCISCARVAFQVEEDQKKKGKVLVSPCVEGAGSLRDILKGDSGLVEKVGEVTGAGIGVVEKEIIGGLGVVLVGVCWLVWYATINAEVLKALAV
ncbi:hypothetical protein HDV05_004971 [Chytridiales sp. JEL 0842]|nr:hypothetical protein HDV05_004971 [Chytridiales sp. JEL 0842]